MDDYRIRVIGLAEPRSPAFLSDSVKFVAYRSMTLVFGECCMDLTEFEKPSAL
jgi:hypothetical protein